MTFFRFNLTSTYRYYIRKFKNALGDAEEVTLRQSAIILEVDFRNPKTISEVQFRNPKTISEVEFLPITEIT